jgi:hypothetical protein
VLPYDFKRIGAVVESLADLPPDLHEARDRTAISRYYYYIFLGVREAILASLPHDGRKEFGRVYWKAEAHQIVPQILWHLGLKKEAVQLQDLRKYRNSADYAITMAKGQVARMLTDTRALMRDLEAVTHRKWKPEQIKRALHRALKGLNKWKTRQH